MIKLSLHTVNRGQTAIQPLSGGMKSGWARHSARPRGRIGIKHLATDRLTGFEEEDGDLAEVEVDEVLGLVSDV